MWFKYLYVSTISFFIALFSLPLFSWAACTGSSPTWTATPDFKSVNQCVSNASAGDTVNISTGTATWTSTLTVIKPVLIIGTGYLDDNDNYQTGTKIINTNGNRIIDIDNNSNGITGNPVRVSGIHFVGNSGDHLLFYVQGGDRSAGEYIDNLIIDNCRFDNAEKILFIRDVVFGVVYKNYFYNTGTGIRIWGDGDDSWNYYSMTPGTSKMLFFEDNYIYFNNSAHKKNDGIFYDVNGGARFVFRYNRVSSVDCTSCYLSIFNLYGGTWATEDYRGTMLVETYNNTVNMNNPQSIFGFRGGSFLAHDNTVTTTEPPDQYISVDEDDGGSYPLEDQVNNSFIWNETLNGSPVKISNIKNGASSIICIQGTPCSTHTEVWMQAPAASGGRNVYPTTSGGTDMYFKSSGANAYYPYTPYTYPHPLTREQIYSIPVSPSSPSPPTGLQIISRQ